MKYVYFVAYVNTNGPNTIHGNAEVVLDRPISNSDDINKIAEDLKTVAGYKQDPAIMWYNLLRQEQNQPYEMH